MNEHDWQCRTELLIGAKSIQILKDSHILIAGLGGVGGYAAEQLCRAGIGKFTLVDCDTVQPSNRNRQIIALQPVEGSKKTLLIADRMRAINPEVGLVLHDEFLNETNIPRLLDLPFDYILDAIDTLSPKVALMAGAVRKGQRIVSSLGSGGKMDPSQIRVTDIRDSFGCKFGYLIRKALHAQGIREGIKVVFSPEKVSKEAIRLTDGSQNKRSIVGTISYMPALFGCFCAAEIIRDLLADQN